MQKFKILDHTADLKIQAWGGNLPEVFVSVALGMASQQLGMEDLNEVAAEDSSFQVLRSKIWEDKWEEINIESADLGSLLVDWLNEILYRGDVGQKLYVDFEILELSKSPAKIKTKIRGAKAISKKLEIKAATYHQLEIKKTDDVWSAVVVFDI